jgi:prolipoprotein diacylglyceryltransferase
VVDEKQKQALLYVTQTPKNNTYNYVGNTKGKMLLVFLIFYSTIRQTINTFRTIKLMMILQCPTIFGHKKDTRHQFNSKGIMNFSILPLLGLNTQILL